ncbi:MAG: DUF6864 domain-containing function [Patescibacteria group bacterium]
MAIRSIDVGSKKLVGAGVLLSYGDTPVTVTLDTSEDLLNEGVNPAVVEFKFLSDSKKESRVERKPQNKLQMTLHFYNFESAIGQTNVEPLRLGNTIIDNKPKYLFLNFRISKIGKIREVAYNFYLLDTETWD